ncbi:MAG: formylglycine-generating enzyme family protein [Gemmatimonadetes bacterium]|nr:formylglycine-generating enzyme family protein [Gemmatimonadota bacterium]
MIRKATVPLAALGLVTAVWIALSNAGSLPQSPLISDDTVNGNPGEVPGFLAEAWQLPDDPLLGFVEIAAGSFLMGSDAVIDPMAFDIERWSSTNAQAVLELPTYYIGRFEVTVAQMRSFVQATGYPIDGQALGGAPGHPATFISWPDALAYSRWLDEILRTSPDTPEVLSTLLEGGGQVTLPTEAEWEKAARGSDGRIYPWGSEPRPDRATYQARGTTAVGSHQCPECPFGLSDMAGNVWEWTRSPYQPYPYDPIDDFEDLENESLWVMRGGSFTDPAHFVRGANRGGADPGARRAFIGFRIAISPS